MRRSLGLLMLMLAGTAPATAQEVPSAPAARVDRSAVAHRPSGMTVRVPPRAAYLGGERFNLYGVADAEVHVFAERGAGGRLERLYWIQFESYLPSRPELAYNYAEGNRRTELWGTTTWLRSGPVPTTGPVREGSDREHVFAILRRANVPIPAEVMNVRMVQLLDDRQGTGRGRRELMLIYSENLAATGKTLADLTTEGRPDERWRPLEQPLIERATRAFRVERPRRSRGD
jgi:hypothetical protein